MDLEKRELLRTLPSVDKFLFAVPDDLKARFSREFLVYTIRKVLERLRKDILSGKVCSVYDGILNEYLSKILEESIEEFNLKKVINATGVIIHTNIGRAPIGEEVANYVKKIMTGYSNLELNLETGKRGIRYRNVEAIFKELTGAEAVCVVNNNAAAVLLVLSSLAKSKEVVVSRGELIEIGGSFRIPDVMEQSGAILREVGATNKTHLGDYEKAINENTALLMKVHTSNYKILGFTKSVSGKELAILGKKYGIPVYEDLGSGSFINVKDFGLSYEPTVKDIIESGVDVVSFSGDKLFGSVQAGIILGKYEFIERIKKHPLNRALRIDKMTLAALEATLKIYIRREYFSLIPVWKMISESYESVEKRAGLLISKLSGIDNFAMVETRDDFSEIGGGALPLEKLSTVTVTVKPLIDRTEIVYERLRNMPVPVICRIRDNLLIFDMRTVFDSEIQTLADEILKALSPNN